MSPRKRVVVIEGEDAAPEAVRPSVALLDRLGVDIEWIHPPVGLAAQERFGTTFPDEARRAIDASDATLFGATSGPSGAAITYLRWGKQTYANVRPARWFPGARSPLARPEGMLRYVTERTDTALGLFNTHAAGWILTPDEITRLADEFSAICAVKNGMFRPSHSAALHRLAPELVIWECDMLAYRGGFLRRGISAPGILGGTAYLYELPDNRPYSAQWDLLVSDKLSEAIDHWYDSGLDDLVTSLHRAFGASNVEAPYTHWGSAFKTAAAELGLPVGDYPRSRPPQPPLPESMKDAVRLAYKAAGFLG